MITAAEGGGMQMITLHITVSNTTTVIKLITEGELLNPKPVYPCNARAAGLHGRRARRGLEGV